MMRLSFQSIANVDVAFKADPQATIVAKLGNRSHLATERGRQKEIDRKYSQGTTNTRNSEQMAKHTRMSCCVPIMVAHLAIASSLELLS